jgi:hypothetical protein
MEPDMRIPASLLTAGVLGLTVLTTACQDTVTDAPPEPAFASVNANAAGGALIVRFNAASFIVHLDGDAGLLSLHAPSTVCGAGSLPVVQVMQVRTPSAIGQFIAQVKSPAEAVTIYHATSFDDAGISSDLEFAGFANLTDVGAFCAFIQGDRRMAEGVVRRVSTFSNASFSAHWTGKIQGPDGERYSLTEVYQLGADAHDPNNPATFVEHVSKIRLSAH